MPKYSSKHVRMLHHATISKGHCCETELVDFWRCTRRTTHRDINVSDLCIKLSIYKQLDTGDNFEFAASRENHK
jgi:hypothetical protein